MRMPSSTLWLAHEQPRQGQIEMIGDALESLQEGKIFLAAAPTGIGKTAAALASCIDFASQDHFQSTIMFLTGKQSQHRIVIDTIRLINNRLPEDQRKILVVDLIGRDSMCKNLDRFQGICQCEGDGFSTPKNIDELRKEVRNFILAYPRHVDETISMARKINVCPWKAARMAVSASNIVVCDYNHLFIDGVREASLPSMGLTLEQTILIVDEAHNLPDRVRMGLERSITPTIVRNASFELEEMQGMLEDGGDEKNGDFLVQHKWALEVSKDLRVRMTQVFQKYLNKLEDVDEYSIDADDLLQIFQTSIDAIQAKGIQENLQGSNTEFRPHPKEALYLFTDLLAANSVSASEEQDEKEQDAHKVSGAIEILQRFAGSTALSVVFDGGGRDGRIRLRLLDPGLVSGPIFTKCKGAMLMSGTLHPPKMYADLLGIPESNANMKAYESPFAKERRPVLVAGDVTTEYKSRSELNTIKMREHIQEVINQCTGHVAVFAPSYFLLEDLMDGAWFQNVRPVVENRDWTKNDVDDLVLRLRELKDTPQRRMIVGVFGGRLSEGVDYHGGLLDAVVCVGIPNPPPSAYQNALKDYMTTRFGKENSWRYASTQPAVNAILQAMGRPIRAIGDRALILLLDKRIEKYNYSRCFPEDIRFNHTSEPSSTGRFARRFFTKVVQTQEK